MPWKAIDVRTQRIEFVVRALQEGANHSALCRAYGISRKTGYKWLRRYAEVGSLAALEELSRRPHRSPAQTPEAIEQRVEQLRRRTGEGGRKLSIRLAAEGVELSPRTVDRILKRRGLVPPRRGHRPAVTRFERSRPNELLQMDFKGPYALRGSGLCYPLSVIDDHSRYALGVFALRSQHGHRVRRRLIECFERFGVPEGMLMDHGNPWWGTTNGHGLTRLSVFLIRQGIRLHYGGIGHPQTQGKVERFQRTLGTAVDHRGRPDTLESFQKLFDAFRDDYNTERPHEALGDRPPAYRYRPSQRTYDPDPAPWDYPADVEVRRVDSNGCLYLDGSYRFVCHALAGRPVGCQRFEQQVLVTYRHMQIREIDLVANRTTSVVRPATDP